MKIHHDNALRCMVEVVFAEILERESACHADEGIGDLWAESGSLAL